MQAAVSVAAPLPAIVNLQNGSIFELSSSGNGGSSSTSSLEPQLSSSIALVMALVLSIVFVIGYLTLFLRQWVSVGAGGGLGGNSRSQFRGVDPDLIGRFPLFQYPGNSSSGSASCSKGATECTVCLSDFEEGEVLLILPACHHAFHRPCINLWLFSHRTCPLCRSSVILLPPKKAAPDRDCSYGRTSIALEMPAMVERVFARPPAAAAAAAEIERRNPSWEFPSGSLMEDKAKEAIDEKNPIQGFPFSAVKEEAAMEGRKPNRGSFQFSTPAEEEEAIEGRSPNRSFPLMEAVSQLCKSHSTGHPFLPSELQYEASMADKSQNAHSISILSSPASSEKKEETMEGGNPNQGFLLTEISSKLWRSHSTGHPFPPSELQYQVSMADKSHNVHNISIFRSSSSSSEAMEGRNPNQGFPSTEIPSQLWKSHSTGHPFLPSDEVSMAGKSRHFHRIPIFSSSSSSEAMEGRNQKQVLLTETSSELTEISLCREFP